MNRGLVLGLLALGILTFVYGITTAMQISIIDCTKGATEEGMDDCNDYLKNQYNIMYFSYVISACAWILMVISMTINNKPNTTSLQECHGNDTNVTR